MSAIVTRLQPAQAPKLAPFAGAGWTPEQAARKLAQAKIHEGYQPQALHAYCDADGRPIYWRVRLKHPHPAPGQEPKWVRPMRRDPDGWRALEPEFPRGRKPLYGPERLAKADPAQPVWIVEGELCVDTLVKLGLVAVTSGGCSSADGCDWSLLKGRSVTVWPDHDDPGARYALDAVHHLQALGCTVRLIDEAIVKALPEGGDVADWLAAHPGATADDVRRLATVSPSTAAQESQESQGVPLAEPEPLRRPVPPALPYPVAELGPVIGPACEAVRRVIQAPDAVCAASLLAAASLATQGLADVHIDGRVHPLSLWLLTIAESGERKSAVDAEAMRGVREAEHALHEAYRAAVAQHEADTEQWNVRREAAKSASRKVKGSGLSNELQAIGPAPNAPLLPFVTVADFTAEGLAKLLRDGRPSVGAFTDEGGLVFGGHGMTQEAVTRTAATLSKLWDRGDMDRIRSLDGATKLYGRRLALHLLVQPVIAERALGDAILSGQGFLARCLLAWPDGTAGSRPYVTSSLRDDPALAQFTTRTRDLLQRPFPLVDGTRNELAPRALRLTDSAKVAWVAAYNAIEAAEAPSGKFAACKIWASKAAEQALRIAGVLTLVESPDAQQIEAGTVKRAAEVALWHLNEALRLAGTAEAADDIRDAEALLSWCHTTHRSLLCSTEALQFGPTRIRDRERFVDAVHLLERAGWASPVEGGADVGGKHRRNVWCVVPRAAGED